LNRLKHDRTTPPQTTKSLYKGKLLTHDQRFK